MGFFSGLGEALSNGAQLLQQAWDGHKERVDQEYEQIAEMPSDELERYFDQFRYGFRRLAATKALFERGYRFDEDGRMTRPG